MSAASWPQLWEQVRPLLELKNQGRPDSQGWVLARCIYAANHKNGDVHFSLRINIKTGGVRCMSQDCPVGPNLNQLAQRLGVKDAESDRPSPEEAMLRLAQERLLSENALRETYGVHAVSGGWAFPVDDPDAHDHPHIKRFSWWPGEPRFWWPKGSKVPARDLVYGLTHLEDGTEYVHVAAGEIDCITLQQAGLPAISFLAGEGAEPSEKAIAKVRRRGIKELRLVYDLDEAGRSGRERVAAACAKAGLDVYIIELPANLGEGGDINDLWKRCEGDLDRFDRDLKACHAFFYSPETIGFESSRRILRTFAEFLEAAQLAGDIEYLVDGLFPADWLLGFVGKPRVGKSLLALDLARCVATGQPFLGRRTKKGPVVYLALEDPPTLVLDRIKALGEVPDAYVYVGPWGEDVLTIIESDLRGVRPSLIIIDPLVATYGSGIRDEADNAAIAAHMAGLYAFGQAVAAAVLVVHHQRKADGPAGDTIRGGSAIFAAVHCVVLATGGPERLELKFLTKTAPVDPMAVTMKDSLSWAVIESAPRTTTEDSVIFALREMKKASAAELTEFLGVARTTINAALTSLQAKDRIVVVEKRAKTPVYGEKTRIERQVPLSSHVPGSIHQDSGGVD